MTVSYVQWKWWKWSTLSHCEIFSEIEISSLSPTRPIWITQWWKGIPSYCSGYHAITHDWFRRNVLSVLTDVANAKEKYFGQCYNFCYIWWNKLKNSSIIRVINVWVSTNTVKNFSRTLLWLVVRWNNAVKMACDKNDYFYFKTESYIWARVQFHTRFCKSSRYFRIQHQI